MNKASESFTGSAVWFTGWLMLVVLFLMSFIGYCVVWGNMSYWGMTVMVNLVGCVPLIGSYVADYLWCSSQHIVNRINHLVGFSGILSLVIQQIEVIELLFLFSRQSSPYYIEFSASLYFASMYWHFVDVIWFVVFMIYFV